MRNFQTLDHITIDSTTGLVELLTLGESTQPNVALKQEGEYIAISVSYGPLEIALRPRLDDLRHALSHLMPMDGLITSRQIGSSESFLAFGLRTDGTLTLRPTLVRDAGGYLALNFRLTPDVRTQLYQWLGVTTK